MIRTATIFCLAVAMLAAVSTICGATYTVTKIADTSDGICDADCSLREAISAANATVNNDIIAFALPFFSSPQTITLSGSELVVANNGSLTIYGPGANRLTINGNNASRILVTGASVVVNLHHLRFAGGNGVGATNSGRGGAIYNVGGTMLITHSILTGNSAANGGALNNAASASPSIPANLTIDNCVISNNSSTSSGGAMQNFSTSTLHVRNTTVNNNSSTSTGIAGAFQANGMVTISNSTFSGNTSSAGTGGGIYYNGTGLTMTNVTVSGNTSALGSGGFHKSITTLNANVRNSIFAGNVGAAGNGDVLGAVTSQGNNIIQVVGTSSGWIKSDLQNMNPLISPLGFYGGFGMTHALLTGSPALNAGQNCVTDLTCPAANPPTALTTDQRGATRVGNVDVGSHEENSAYIAQLPSALVLQPYNQVLVPNVGPFTYSMTSGSLPTSTTLVTGPVTVSVTGTPNQFGSFNFGVTATNGINSAVINYGLNVLSTVSTFPVSGIVVTSTGEPIRGAIVGLIDLNGNARSTRTNSFGYFHFAGLPAGSTFVLVVSSKEYEFDSRTITILDETDTTVSAEP